MQDFRQGEVVLIAFPFADASGTKRRPALVILDTGDQDLVVVRVTSQRAQTAFDVDIEHWREAGLLLPSAARVHKLATLEKRLVERRLGAVTPDDWKRVHSRIRQLVDSIPV